MEWMSVNELRDRYLKFFQSKGHTIMESAPLVPKDDAGLLLINSGMAPLKKYFLGLETPPNKRVTTCQKCIRTPDIERVGKTARHGTYFEMLGNFSFGDYFKVEATQWAWEFITKEMEMPLDRLWVSIYLEDDEAFDIWTKQVGVDPNRIVRLGKADNFWEIGTGPCGPCSEIYYDRGEEHGCDNPECAVGCDCDRYVEFWNLVFTQYNSDGEGNYTLLEKPNIDTGMGLERLGCISQNVNNLFEVDTVKNIMDHICKIADITYKEDEKRDVSLRVITDHIRSTTFMIGDGVVPLNEGRGYVLRRLLRRAARHGRLLGITRAFLFEVCETVIKENATAYPELVENKDYIIKVIKTEEERFAKTIDQGMDLLATLIESMETSSLKSQEKILSGDEAFKLYDTFGFPVDLTREILEEKGMRLDEDQFVAKMNEQRERARAATAAIGDKGWEGDVLAGMDITTDFVGYDKITHKSKVLAIIVEGALAETINEGQEGVVILGETPFYAESGGQIGDSGVIEVGNNTFAVRDTKKSPTGNIIHIGKMEAGFISTGNEATAVVSSANRNATTRNHSACHLLQQALREVLGNHVHQSGSYVDTQGCRFDFSHFDAMTPEQIDKVEYLVNDMILQDLAVEVEEMSIDAAKGKGAIALFGEKYGNLVRVADMGGRSVELCGGTHVKTTANIGLFKILKESSVAAGIRRIEAVTGRGVLKLIDRMNATMTQAAEPLKLGNLSELPNKVNAVMAEMKEKDREIDALNQKLASMEMKGMFSDATMIGDIKFIATAMTGAKADKLRLLGDKIKENQPNVVAVLSTVNDDKGSILVVCGKEAVAAGAHAGKLVKEITSLVGGSGGGKPDSAMGGATEIFKIDEAVAKVPEMIKAMISK